MTGMGALEFENYLIVKDANKKTAPKGSLYVSFYAFPVASNS